MTSGNTVLHSSRASGRSSGGGVCERAAQRGRRRRLLSREARHRMRQPRLPACCALGISPQLCRVRLAQAVASSTHVLQQPALALPGRGGHQRLRQHGGHAATN